MHPVQVCMFHFGELPNRLIRLPLIQVEVQIFSSYYLSIKFQSTLGISRFVPFLIRTCTSFEIEYSKYNCNNKTGVWINQLTQVDDLLF